MKIDYSKLKKKSWYEDENGNEISSDDAKQKDIVYYHSCFPLELNHKIDSYCYHIEHNTNNIFKLWLNKHSKKYHKYLLNKNKHNKTFKHMVTFTTTYGSGQKCIVAMVNSGDFTLEEAIYVYANSCERCMNSLEYKYLNGEEGYPEFSDEWKKCNTECDFCRDIEIGEPEQQNVVEFDNTLYLEDIIGTIGKWLEMDTSKINKEAISNLQKTYDELIKQYTKI